MLRDKLNKKNNGQQLRGTRRYDQSLPVYGSPAQQGFRGAREEQSRPLAERRRYGANAERHVKMSYAAEDRLAPSVATRKSLPPLRSKVSNADIPVASGRRPRANRTGSLRIPHTPVQAAAPVQVISDEEQKKLAALEMQLPRVAGKIDSVLLIVVLALICFGLVMVYSASSFVAAQNYSDVSYFFQKQLFGALLGGVAMLVTMRVDYRLWRRYSLFGMAIALPLLVIVLLFGTNAYGASRWLTLGPFLSFQPSELIKLILALYIADWLARKGNQVGTFLYGLAPFIILVGLVLGLVLLENDMGTAIVIASLTAAMFFTAGANILQFMLAMGCGGLVFMTQAFHGYRLQRLIGFLNPFQHVTDINLQLYQSLLALGSGGWFGLGLGQSRQKTGYLPFPQIDSIFAIIGEELGFIGAAILILLFLMLAFRGFRLARRTQDVYGALLATGITTWLVLQAIINIGSTTASVPYTGVPLPFISYGGTSLVISMAAVGSIAEYLTLYSGTGDPLFSRYTITKSGRKKI